MRFFYCFPSLSDIYVAGSQCHLWPFISPPFFIRSSPNWSSSYILYFSLPLCHHCHPRSGSLCLLLGLLRLNGTSYWVLVFLSFIHLWSSENRPVYVIYPPKEQDECLLLEIKFKLLGLTPGYTVLPNYPVLSTCTFLEPHKTVVVPYL